MKASLLVIGALAGAPVWIACRAAPEGVVEPAHVARVAPPDADDELREVVMRELIGTFGAMEWQSAPGEQAVRVNVLCIGFGENLDPSDAFMERIADEHRVVKASHCRYDDGGRVVRALPSGLPATILHVEDIRRDGARAHVKGRYFHDGKAAQEDDFVLERGADRWLVKSRKMISIS